MTQEELTKRAISRHELVKEAAEKTIKDTNNLFGVPTPGGESMMLHTRQCPECQVGQAGPVPGKPTLWQCIMCGSTWNTETKGDITKQLPYDAAFYGGGPFLSAPSNAPHRNTSSIKPKLTRKADFRGSVSQFCIDIKDVVNGAGKSEDKEKIGKVLSMAMGDGDLYGAINKIYGIEQPVEEVEVVSEPTI